MMKEAKDNVLNKCINDVISKLTHMSEDYSSMPMLSRTHG